MLSKHLTILVMFLFIDKVLYAEVAISEAKVITASMM